MGKNAILILNATFIHPSSTAHVTEKTTLPSVAVHSLDSCSVSRICTTSQHHYDAVRPHMMHIRARICGLPMVCTVQSTYWFRGFVQPKLNQYPTMFTI